MPPGRGSKRYDSLTVVVDGIGAASARDSIFCDASTQTKLYRAQ
jgi:hypothetical protein